MAPTPCSYIGLCCIVPDSVLKYKIPYSELEHWILYWDGWLIFFVSYWVLDSPGDISGNVFEGVLRGSVNEEGRTMLNVGSTIF